MTSLIYVCSIFICKLMCRLICKIHTPSPTHKHIYFNISFVLPFFYCFMDKFSVWLTTKQHRMHAYTLWLCIFLFIKYYTLCSFFIQTRSKIIYNIRKKNLSNSFILLVCDFWCWNGRKDKDKKQQHQQQMQDILKLWKNNQLFN